MHNKGKFITFEGVEGAGKTTLINALNSFLQDHHIETHITREPGGSENAEKIRSLFVKGDPDRWDSICELLLVYTARRDHYYKVILPLLEKNVWVLCDRFSDSTFAYQGYGHNIPLDIVKTVDKIAINNAQPDLTFVLDLPVEEGLKRAHKRFEESMDEKEDRFEKMNIDFHQRVRNGFLEIGKNNPDRCFLLEATQSIDMVQKQMLDIVGNCYNFVQDHSKIKA